MPRSSFPPYDHLTATGYGYAVMPYVLAGALVVAGLLVLVAVLVRVRRSVRLLSGTAAAANFRISDGFGLLRARKAALGVAIRHARADE